MTTINHADSSLPSSLVKGERGLVAVMAVGNQELRILELFGQRVAEPGIEAPELRLDAALVRLEIGIAEAVDADRPVPEQEDRLQVGARRA